MPVAKIQLSSAAVYRPGQMDPASLAAFTDEVYLHQTSVRSGDEVGRHLDLPGALAAAGDADEWRIHFHVPLYADSTEGLSTTRDLLTGPFAERLRNGACEHLEVETYTWGLLPGGDRREALIENIARELRWARELVTGRVRRSRALSSSAATGFLTPVFARRPTRTSGSLWHPCTRGGNISSDQLVVALQQDEALGLRDSGDG